MTTENRPFHETEYIEEDGELCPILKVLVGRNRKPLSVYADTGCTTGIAVFKEQIKGVDIGEKISDRPSPCIMADGHIIGADEYLTTLRINGEEKEVVVSVIDPDKILGTAPVDETKPLLGRDFLDAYDVLFKGKEKRVALFKC